MDVVGFIMWFVQNCLIVGVGIVLWLKAKHLKETVDAQQSAIQAVQVEAQAWRGLQDAESRNVEIIQRSVESLEHLLQIKEKEFSEEKKVMEQEFERHTELAVLLLQDLGGRVSATHQFVVHVITENIKMILQIYSSQYPKMDAAIHAKFLHGLINHESFNAKMRDEIKENLGDNFEELVNLAEAPKDSVIQKLIEESLLWRTRTFKGIQLFPPTDD